MVKNIIEKKTKLVKTFQFVMMCLVLSMPFGFSISTGDIGTQFENSNQEFGTNFDFSEGNVEQSNSQFAVQNLNFVMFNEVESIPLEREDIYLKSNLGNITENLKLDTSINNFSNKNINGGTFEEEGYAKLVAYGLIFGVGYSFAYDRYGGYTALRIASKSGLSIPKFFTELAKAEAKYQGKNCVMQYLGEKFKSYLKKKNKREYIKYVDQYLLSKKCLY